MTTYAAFLRGIMPMNPNMRNEKLRSVFESLGLENVRSVIASGNLIFETDRKDVVKMEGEIEKALASKLNIKCPTFIRSQKELEAIIKKDPFKGGIHSRESYLVVTFLNKKPREIFNIIDLSKGPNPEFMNKLEKEHGKEITTRTWKTIQRMVEKMR
jgi:uncharacterized protein (DUF1697 family)